MGRYSKKQKLVFLLIIIFIFIASLSLTYSYFTVQNNLDKESNLEVVTTGTLELYYSDGPQIMYNNIYPGTIIQKTIVVTNTGTLDALYEIGWESLNNEIINGELVFSYACNSYVNYGLGNQESLGSCGSVYDIPVGTMSYDLLASNVDIESGVTQVYDLEFEFIETGEEQNYNQGKNFNGVINIYNSNTKLVNVKGEVIDSNGDAISGVTVELHSRVRSTITNSYGRYYFTGVEPGDHEIIVKNGNETLFTDEIELKLSNTASINGNIVNWDPSKDYYLLNMNLDSNNELDNYEIKYDITSSRCFSIDLEDGYDDVYSVNGYYKYELDDPNNRLCPTDVVIAPTYTSWYSSLAMGIVNNTTVDVTIVHLSNNPDSNHIENLIIMDGIEHIYEMGNFGIKNVVLPSTLITIGSQAFANNQLTNVTIPNNVTTIGDLAFANNQLTSAIIIGKSEPMDFERYGENYFLDIWGWSSEISCVNNYYGNADNGCITWYENGSFVINDGNQHTSRIAVVIDSLPNNAKTMCVSNTDICENYEPFRNSKEWTLPGGDGVKTVYVTYKDSDGNIIETSSDSIILDTTPPTNNSISISNGSGRARTLTLSSTDATKMCFSNTSNNSSDCLLWIDYETSYGWLLNSGIWEKTVYAFFKDVAGNISDVVSATTSISSSPVTINENFTYTTYDPNISINGSGSYPWVVNTVSGRFESNNKGVHSSSSVSTIMFIPNNEAILSFDYGVSSESGWDELTITLTGDDSSSVLLVSAISGTESGNARQALNVGVLYTLTLTYTKDDSNDKEEDIAYIDNLVIQ